MVYLNVDSSQNIDCKEETHNDKLRAIKAFEEQSRRAKRALQDAKNAHWKLLEKHMSVLNACQTPEEIEAARKMLVAALKI